MKRAFTPGLSVSAASIVRRTRELPLKGELLCRVGDLVSAQQVVARAELAGELQILRIAEKMSLTPEEVMQGLKVRVGAALKPGALVCEHRGLFGLFTSRFVSEVSGKVELITALTGHIGVRAAPQPLELNAYIDGKIVDAVPGRSVTIESRAALVQGIFGVGGERYGELRAFNCDIQAPITPREIPQQCKDQILFGGSFVEFEALKTAAERGAVGLVCGSVDDRCLAAYLGFDLGVAITGDEDVPLTLIVTEGFGSLAMSKRTHGLLSSLAGRKASINGATQVRAGALRPEIIVQNQSSAAAVDELERALIVGARVRIIRFPYFGRFATVDALPHEPQEIESGAVTRVLKAKLDDGSFAIVPRANVEMV